MKIQMSAIILGMLAGCSGAETTSTTTGTGGTTTASASSGGTGGSTTATTTAATGGGGSGGSCDVPGPAPCGPVDPTGYPDPLLGYDPDEAALGMLHGFPDEVPGGAAAVWLGPFADDMTVTGLVFEGLGGGDAALWTEALCGLPSKDPSAHVVALAADGTTLAEPFAVTAGQVLVVARVLTTSGVAVRTYDHPGGNAFRAVWFGRVDNDCDGKTDAKLGWAALGSPTDPTVDPFPFDLALGVTLAP